jgi:serine/threonine protein kinase
LRSATENFNRSNKIGRGGFGTVYKGTIRNGRDVAVKVLSAESRQGVREFLTEIDVITNVKHPNLVELIGCCVEGNNRILVYEYLENSSLDRALLGSNSEPANFTWSIRSAICIGIAKGLAYLHEEIASPIVHRDIKASNILLDKLYNPKIGDFGLAKLFPDNITHISTRVAGTTGYLAPEYAWHGQLTKRADIYSFGVLVLEIVSGKSSSRSLLADDKILLEKVSLTIIFTIQNSEICFHLQTFALETFQLSRNRWTLHLNLLLENGSIIPASASIKAVLITQLYFPTHLYRFPRACLLNC